MNKNSNKHTDLSLKAFIKNFTTEAFHIDSRIYRTLYALIMKPGQLTLAYFNSSEKKYIQPLRLYFVINILFFLATPLLNTPKFQVFSFTMDSICGSNQIYQNIITGQIQTIGVSEEIYEERFDTHIKYNQPALVFLIIPFFALILKLVYLRGKRYYIEHLYFSIHFLSFFLLLVFIIISLYRILSFGLGLFSDSIGDIIAFILIAALLIWLSVYLILAVRAFYKNRFLLSLLQSTILLAGFFIAMSGYLQFLFFYTILALRWGY